MIVIHTPTTGTHKFPGEHEVTNTGGTLKLTRAGKPVAAFREWSFWKEAPETPEKEPVRIG